MTDTFRESLTNNWNIVGTLPLPTTGTTTETATTPTTDSSIHWLAQHPTRRRRDQMKHDDEHQHHQTTRGTSARRARRGTAPIMVLAKAADQQKYHNNNNSRPVICLRSRAAMSTKERTSPYLRALPAGPVTMKIFWLALASCLLLLGPLALADDSVQKAQQAADPRSTQPTLDRQLESPSSSSSSSSSSSTSTNSNSAPVKPQQPQQPAASPSSPASDSSRQQHETPTRPSSVVPAPKPQKLAATLASQKRAAALAAQRDYDKYQLKASSSTSPARVAAQAAESANTAAADLQKQTDKDKEKDKEKEKANSSGNNNNGQGNNNKQETSSSSSSSSSVEPAHKKVGQLPNTRPHPKASAFSLLRKFLPSFMTSAAAAAAAASASAVADKQPHQNQHSRSSPGTSSSLLSSLLSASSSSVFSGGSSSASGQQQSSSAASGVAASQAAAAGESSGSPLTGKIINLLTGAQKKKGLPEGVSAAGAGMPNHAPFFMRKSATDRQAGGGALALASGLLSNPLKLGLLFSAPLLPSLLLTPLAIAGLSPAMSAINNFFGDDDEPSASSQSPLSALASGSSSPWASILQATGGASPSSASGGGGFSDSSSSSSSSGSSGSALSGGNSLALQALQSFVLGPTSTTERPLFKPGMFASSGIQNAAGAISSAISSGQQSSSGSNNNNQRPFFGSGAGLMQAAASMISPSFAAPPSSSSSSGSNSNSNANSNNDDDDRGLIQMASDVFEKVANYMGNDNTKDGQSIAQQASGAGGGPANSPALSALASLSSMSPFQLSSLFPSSLGQASGSSSSGSLAASSGSSSAVGNKNQRVGFFSTLRNVYELFSSSFLRRQEVGNENECQQRLVCELHQRAMNSKMFRRSLQTSLAELASLDKNLLEQIKYGSQAIQARVDPDTKAMLNDFLKATNNFKSGREMINCSQMFPKCTRTQLLAAANAHLADPVNGRAIGKFSQLMKKMKFKANQQSTSQWKLRKPGKSSAANLGNQATRLSAPQPAQVSQPMDHMQVVPLQSPAISNANGQFTPADSLKLAQQIMLLSQMSQQQPQQQPQQQQWSSPAMTPVNYPQSIPPMVQQSQLPQQQQQQPLSYSASSFSSTPVQYSPAPKQQTTYTDAMVPTVYSSPTDSPYFMPNVASQQQPQQQQPQLQQQQQPQPQQYMSSGSYVEANQQQVVQPVAAANQQQSNNGNNQQQQQQSSSSYQAADQSMPQQQQPSRGLNMDNKNKPQQLLASNNKMAALAA